jgi:hypothetical protein
MIAVHQTPLTAAQILLLNGTPAEVLPAPLTGYINIILGVSINYTYVSAAFATHTTLQILDASTTPTIIYSDTTALVATSNINTPMSKATAAFCLFATINDLKITVGTGNPTAGTSTIVVSVIFDQKLIA